MMHIYLYMYIYLSSMNPRISRCAYALGGLCASVRISRLITLVQYANSAKGTKITCNMPTENEFRATEGGFHIKQALIMFSIFINAC